MKVYITNKSYCLLTEVTHTKNMYSILTIHSYTNFNTTVISISNCLLQEPAIVKAC